RLTRRDRAGRLSGRSAVSLEGGRALGTNERSGVRGMVARTAAMKPLIAYVRKAVPGLCLAACLLLPRVASAQPSANEKAAAEALFRQGTELSAEERFREACVKFEGSQRLDPALGTMLHLAECYDRIGKTASAWAMFTEAAAIARSTNQPEREQIATAR